MIKVIILIQDEPFFKTINPNLKFIKRTADTSEFNVSQPTFYKILDYIAKYGKNPYSLMSW